MSRLVTRHEPLTRTGPPAAHNLVPPPGTPRHTINLPAPKRESPAAAARRAGARSTTTPPLTRAAREHHYRRQTGRRALTPRQRRRVDHKTHRNPEKESPQ